MTKQLEDWQRQMMDSLEVVASRLDKDIEECKLRVRHLKMKRRNVLKLLEEMTNETQADWVEAEQEIV